MCIVVLSTSHPDYPLILINNRDEYLRRPTAPAEFWPSPHEHVLGGRDLFRPIQGTWLAMTRQGRIAVLTNFREEGQPAICPRSRGAMVKDFVTHSPGKNESTETFLKQLFEEGEGVKGIGGFSLLCGQLQRNGDGLAIISNRTPDIQGVTRIAKTKGEVHGLSNSFYGDQTWPKITMGEQLLQDAIHKSIQQNENKEELVERLMQVLSTDTLPRAQPSEDWDIYLRQLRHSVFIPKIAAEKDKGLSADKMAAASAGEKAEIVNDRSVLRSPAMTGPYGTQRQTVILVDKHGKATFVERSVYDEDANLVEPRSGDRWFEFDIENWS